MNITTKYVFVSLLVVAIILGGPLTFLIGWVVGYLLGRMAMKVVRTVKGDGQESK